MLESKFFMAVLAVTYMILASCEKRFNFIMPSGIMLYLSHSKLSCSKQKKGKGHDVTVRV